MSKRLDGNGGCAETSARDSREKQALRAAELDGTSGAGGESNERFFGKEPALMSSMSLSPIRTTLSLFMATLGFVTAGCSTSTDETSTTSTTSTDAELSVEPSASSASLTLSGEGGACTAFKGLVDAHVEELKALCAEKQIALPSVIDREGCEKGTVKSVTFTCFDAQGPGRPGEGQCRPMAIKDKKGALPEACADHAEDLQPVVCPRVDGMEPPPPPADGSAPPAKADAEGGKPAGPPPAGPPPAGAGTGTGAGAPPAGGAPPPGGAGAAPDGSKPKPPRLQCCAPPPGGPKPPKGGGTSGGAPPAGSSSEAPTPAQ